MKLELKTHWNNNKIFFGLILLPCIGISRTKRFAVTKYSIFIWWLKLSVQLHLIDNAIERNMRKLEEESKRQIAKQYE